MCGWAEVRRTEVKLKQLQRGQEVLKLLSVVCKSCAGWQVTYTHVDQGPFHFFGGGRKKKVYRSAARLQRKGVHEGFDKRGDHLLLLHDYSSSTSSSAPQCYDKARDMLATTIGVSASQSLHLSLESDRTRCHSMSESSAEVWDIISDSTDPSKR